MKVYSSNYGTLGPVLKSQVYKLVGKVPTQRNVPIARKYETFLSLLLIHTEKFGGNLGLKFALKTGEVRKRYVYFAPLFLCRTRDPDPG
jgi:hypothetical protein